MAVFLNHNVSDYNDRKDPSKRLLVLTGGVTVTELVTDREAGKVMFLLMFICSGRGVSQYMYLGRGCMYPSMHLSGGIYTPYTASP